MKKFIRYALAFVAATLTGYGVAAIIATQTVLMRLSEMGVPVTLGQRADATLHDLVGMVGLYLPILGVGFLVAFLVAGLFYRSGGPWRTQLYALSGLVAVVTAHLTLNAVFDITPVAAARTVGGLLLQGLAGALAGYVFARLTRSPASSPTYPD